MLKQSGDVFLRQAIDEGVIAVVGVLHRESQCLDLGNVLVVEFKEGVATFVAEPRTAWVRGVGWFDVE